MSFPSLRLVKFFKGKIRDFNAQNNYGMTPLHLFSSKTKDPNLLGTTLAADYNALEVLEYLLSNGCNPNCLDISKAMPIHYAAKNNQLEFIVSLRKHKS